MFFLNGDGISSSFVESCIEKRFFEFIPNKDDYMLTYTVSWDEVLTDIYQFAIGNESFFIPSGIYIFCGDEYGIYDWVLSDEIIGRSIPVITSDERLTEWTSEIPKLISTFPNHHYFPFTNNPIPITNKNGKKTLVVSKIDLYHKMDTDIATMFG